MFFNLVVRYLDPRKLPLVARISFDYWKDSSHKAEHYAHLVFLNWMFGTIFLVLMLVALEYWSTLSALGFAAGMVIEFGVAIAYWIPGRRIWRAERDK